jgi:hypothetical protein
MLLVVPVWVSEPPQNNLQECYGVGVAEGMNAEAIEKARLKARKDLVSRIYVSVNASLTENRQTTQRNTFFRKVRDTQNVKEDIEVISSLIGVPGVSDLKIELSNKHTYCLVHLNKKVLFHYFSAKFCNDLMEIHFLPENSQERISKLRNLKENLHQAGNLGFPILSYERKCTAYETNKDFRFILDASNKQYKAYAIVTEGYGKEEIKPWVSIEDIEEEGLIEGSKIRDLGKCEYQPIEIKTTHEKGVEDLRKRFEILKAKMLKDGKFQEVKLMEENFQKLVQTNCNVTQRFTMYPRCLE